MMESRMEIPTGAYLTARRPGGTGPADAWVAVVDGLGRIDEGKEKFDEA